MKGKETVKNGIKIKKHLTVRELEVLQYVIQGMTNKEIARILSITDHTVKAHIASVIRKLGVKNRLEVALIAVTEGIANLHQD